MLAVTPYSPQEFFFFILEFFFQEFLTLARNKQFQKIESISTFFENTETFCLKLFRKPHKKNHKQASVLSMEAKIQYVHVNLTTRADVPVDVWHSFLSLFKLLCLQGEGGSSSYLQARREVPLDEGCTAGLTSMGLHFQRSYQ